VAAVLPQQREPAFRLIFFFKPSATSRSTSRALIAGV
jgi:hypothetical protein